jgi:UDP-glucose:(heptosyl)LPS alpha-1,3-glucosyltransferase
LKIALVIHKYDAAGGGAERWTDRHARMLVTNGHDVHVVAASIYDAPKGVTCHVIGAGTRRGPFTKTKAAQQMAQFLRKQSFEIIHDMGVSWYCDLFMPHHGTHRSVYDQRSTNLILPERCIRNASYCLLPRYLQFQYIEKRQYARASKKLFIAVSNMVRQQIMANHNVPEDRIRVVYNGIDTQHFRPARATPQRDSLRRQLGFTDHTLFLMVANDFDLKGLNTILHAMATLRRKGMRVGMMVVGAGTMKGRKVFGLSMGRACDRFSRLARKLGCDDVIRFVGYQDRPLPYYHAADVYVQPSLYDACSLVVLEAMACGLPVITSKHNGVSSLITPDSEGRVIDDPHCVNELAAAMQAYLDPMQRQAVGRRARCRAEKHSAQHNYDEITALYNEHVQDRTRNTADSQTKEQCAYVR